MFSVPRVEDQISMNGLAGSNTAANVDAVASCLVQGSGDAEGGPPISAARILERKECSAPDGRLVSSVVSTPFPASLVARGDGTSIASPQQRVSERKQSLAPTGGVPPPPSSPPPRLARRASQRETKLIGRYDVLYVFYVLHAQWPLRTSPNG